MIFKRTIKILSLFGYVGLGGCTGMTYSNHFDCPYGTGAGCASLSKVNKMIDQHQINLEEDTRLDKCQEGNGGSCKNKMKQVYIYYGPDQMSKIVTIESPPEQLN